MSVTTTLAAGRRAAEALMLDTGKALRPTGGTIYDDATQSDVAATDDLFTSRCKIQGRNLVANDSEVGGRTATTVRLELHLPADTDPLTTGDLFEVTQPGPLSTVAAGTRYRITAPFGKTTATARRYEIEETAS